MAVPTTYSELQTSIGSWLDERGTMAKAPEYIRYTEDCLNNGYEGQYSIPPLRTREMVTTAALASSGSELTLPTDWLETIAMTTASGGATYGLEQRGISGLNYDFPTSYGGVGANYGLVGSEVRVRPSAAASIIYYAKIPNLSNAAPTNWLLTKHPSLYLTGAVFWAALDVMDQEQIANKATIFAGLIKGLNDSDARARHGGRARVVGGVP